MRLFKRQVSPLRSSSELSLLLSQSLSKPPNFTSISTKSKTVNARFAITLHPRMALTRPVLVLLLLGTSTLFASPVAESSIYRYARSDDGNSEIVCVEDGFFSHPSDCAKYYRCVNGHRFDFNCGPGTHYNPSIVGCDHPDRAACRHAQQHESGQQSGQTEVELFSDNTNTKNTEKVDGASTGYIDCVNVCREKHYPTFEKLRREDFQSGQQHQHPEMAQIIQEPGYVYYRKKVIRSGDGSQWESWGNQGQFEQYREGVWHLQIGQPDWGQPEYNWKYDKGSATDAKYEKNIINNQEIVCIDDGFFPHPADCAKYYRCNNGRRFDFDCGPGTHYNGALKVCVHPNQANCDLQQQKQSANTKTTTTTTTTIIKRRLLVPFIVHENGKSVERKFAFETLNHGVDQDAVQNIKKCESQDGEEKLCTLNNFEWLQVADTELDQKKIKPKRELKVVREIPSVGEECHRQCAILGNGTGSPSVQCIAYTFSTDSRKCQLFDQLELNFNWVAGLIKGGDQQRPKGLRSKRHISTRINLPRTYQLQEGWLIGPSVPKDLVKKPEQSKVYKLIDMTYSNVHNCLTACINQQGCQRFVFDSTTGRCFLRRDWEQQSKEDDSSEEDSSEEKDDEEKKTKTIIYKAGWMSGQNVDHFAQVNKGKVEVVQVNEMANIPGGQNQNQYWEYRGTQQMTEHTGGQSQKPQSSYHTNKQEGSETVSNVIVTTKVDQTHGGQYNHHSEANQPSSSQHIHSQEIRRVITSGKTVCLEEGLFPHPTSCSKYYECSNGEIFTKDCAPGTLYNPLIKACDFPDKSGCSVNEAGQTQFEWKEVITGETGRSNSIYRPAGGTTKTVKTVTTKKITSGKMVCLEEGLFPHPTSCSQFYVCSNGELLTKDCTHPGTLYNPLTKTCDSPEKSGCRIGANGQTEFEWKSVVVSKSGKSGQSMYPSNQATSSSKMTTTTRTVVTRIINGSVVEMANGPDSKVVIHQPTGNHFHTHHSSTFEGEPQSYSQSQVVKKVITTGKTICLEDGIFPHSSDCSKFLHCANGQLFTKDCAPGTHYNPLIKNCDWPKKAGCRLNANGQVEFEWTSEITADSSQTSPIDHGSRSSSNTVVTTIHKKMLIPFARYGNASSQITYEQHGRLIPAEVITELDGVGLKIKDVPTCTPENADSKLCALRHFKWLQMKDQEIINKGSEVKPKKEVTIEKNKNIGEECHKLCLALKPTAAVEASTGDSYLACVAYTFNDESRKCILYDQIVLEHNWVDVLVSGEKKPKNLRPKRHTISRVNIPQSFIAESKWLISPSVPRELVSKKQTSDYRVFDLANASITECINVCEHSPVPCQVFIFDLVDGKCFLKKEKKSDEEEEKDSSEEDDDDEEDKKFKKIVYKSGWVSGKNLHQLISQGAVSDRVEQVVDTNEADGLVGPQKIIRTKEYIDIVKPQVPGIDLDGGTYPGQPAAVPSRSESSTKITSTSTGGGQPIIQKPEASEENVEQKITVEPIPSGTTFTKKVVTKEEAASSGSNEILQSNTMKKKVVVKIMKTKKLTSGKVVCVEDGLFAHPWSCSKYFECANGAIISKDCAPGTFYNPLIDGCDFPANSGCKLNKDNQTEFVWKKEVTVSESSGGQISQPGSSRPVVGGTKTVKIVKTKTITSGKVVCLEEGLFPHPTSCSQFYVCSNGELLTKDCTHPGTLYNPLTKTCDSPEKSGCRIGANGQTEFEWKSVLITEEDGGILRPGQQSNSGSGSTKTIRKSKTVITKLVDGTLVEIPDSDAKVTTDQPSRVEQVVTSSPTEGSHTRPKTTEEPIGKDGRTQEINIEQKAEEPNYPDGNDPSRPTFGEPETQVTTTQVTDTKQQPVSEWHSSETNRIIQTNGHQLNPGSQAHTNSGTKITTVITKPGSSATSSSTLTTRKVTIAPFLIYKNATREAISKRIKIAEKYEDNDDTANQIDDHQSASSSSVSTVNTADEHDYHHYLHGITSCTSKDQKLCNLNNFEWLQIADTEIGPQTRVNKEETFPGGDLERCHNACLTMRQKSSPDWLGNHQEEDSATAADYQSCVAYSYSLDTGKCLLYEEIELPVEWIQQLTSGSTPSALRTKRDTTTRVTIPQFELQFNTWLIGASLPVEYMQNMGFRSGQIPIVAATADQIYEPFKAELIECASACEKSRHECRQFVYNTDSRMCYYVGPEEGDLSVKVLLKTGWLSGLLFGGGGEAGQEVVHSEIKCTDDGYFANPTNCAKYYRCAGGRRYDFDCGPGTHYNPAIMNCDWPSNAGCSGAGVRLSNNTVEHVRTDTKQTGSAPLTTDSSSRSSKSITTTRVIRRQFRMPYLAFKTETRELIERIYGKEFIEQNWLNASKSHGLENLPACGAPNSKQALCTINKEWLQLTDSEISSEVAKPFSWFSVKDKQGDLSEACFKACQTMKSQTAHSEMFIPCVAYSYSTDTGKCTLYDQLNLATNWLETLTSKDTEHSYRTKRQTITRVNIPRADIVRNWLIGPNLPAKLMTIIASTDYANLIESGEHFIDVLNAATIEKCSKTCAQATVLYRKRCSLFLLNSVDQMCFLVNEKYLQTVTIGDKMEYRAGWVSGENLVEDTNEEANVLAENEVDGGGSGGEECFGTEFYGHPSDCSRFYRCVYGQFVTFDCAPGTHFNEKANTCDWPHKAGCKDAGASEVVEEVIKKEECKTCTGHDHSEDVGHSHGTKNNHGHEHTTGVLTEDDVRQMLAEYGEDFETKTLESTTVDEKTKTIQLPFVVSDNETLMVPKLGADDEDTEAQEVHEHIERSVSTFSTCQGLNDTASSKRPCTLGNYEWLQMSDTTFAPEQVKSQREVKLTARGQSTGETCHRLCQKMTPLEEGSSFGGHVSCVAYSFEPETGQCTLYSELELAVNWVTILETTTTTTTTTIFRNSPGVQTRINVPRAQFILRQWLISPAIPLGISYSKTTTGETIYSTTYELVDLVYANFFGCFKACVEKSGCLALVYNAVDRKCFLKKRDEDVVPTQESEENANKITYRSGWISAVNIRQRPELLEPRNLFYTETNPAILDLIEQYLLKTDYNSLISNNQRKYLNPIATITAASPGECEARCAETWGYSEAEEKDMNWLEEDEEDGGGELEEQVVIRRRKRFLNLKKHLDRYSSTILAKKEAENKKDAEKYKYKCKFVAVRENLVEQTENKTYTCQLFSEEAIAIQIKLLSKLTKQKRHILAKAAGNVASFVKGGVGKVTGFLKNPFGRKSRRSWHAEEQLQHHEHRPAPLNAYVFYDNPTIRFYRLDEVESIRQAEASQQSYMNWDGVLSDQKCFKECLISWNKLIGGRDGRKCRFLVVRATEEAGNTTYNCAFYESDPSQPVTGYTTLQYGIHSYPYEVPVSFSHSAAYFSQLKDNSGSPGTTELKRVDSLDSVEEINYCLHHCLKQWIKPKAPFSLDGPKCRHVAVVEDTVSRKGFTRYNCTFSDLPEVSQSWEDNSALRSLGATGQVAFQLRQLPTSDEFKNKSLKHIEYFDAIPVQSAMVDTVLSQHKPLYLLDYPQDYSECLKICVDLWARIKLGDSRPDRCRLVVVKKSTGDDQYRRVVTKAPLFQCAIYDMVLEKQLLRANRSLSTEQLQLTRIYRHKVSNISTSDIQTAEDYETIPPAIVTGVLGVIAKQTKSFYHFTRARSGRECLDHCLEMKATGHQEQCQLVVAKATIGEDRQTGRRQIEYECTFYDYSLEFTAEEQNSPKKKSVPLLEAYQLMRSERSAESHFDRVDADSESVRYATESYEPIHAIQNATSRDQCLEECLQFKVKNRMHGLINSMDCQLVTVAPRIVKEETVVDYICNFYNFNVTEHRLADLDIPEPVQGYELNWHGFGFADLFNANFHQSKTASKFSPINSLRSLHATARQRKAFFHVSSVKEPTECFSLCLNTWTMGFLFNAERRLCRFVTVRTKYDAAIANNVKFDCSLYSHNLTDSLQSLHILLQPPCRNPSPPSIPKNQIITEAGSLYSNHSWNIPAPYETDAAKVLENPTDLAHCLKECDRMGVKCAAVLALTDTVNGGGIVKCQLISGEEYYPNLDLKPSEEKWSSLLVKITNIDEHLRGHEVSASLQDREQRKNPYLSIIKAVRNYQLNEPLAEKLRS